MSKVDATEVLLKIQRNASKPIIVLEGSARSSKTFSAIQYFIIKRLNNPGTSTRHYRLDQTTCRKTLIPDFLWLMQNQFTEEWDPKRWNKSEAVYTYKNSSQTYFDGCETDKLHGLTQDDAHVNEIMENHYENWQMIVARTRDQKMIDYNPSRTVHFVFSTILTRDPSEFAYIHSTYKDNPFITDEQRSQIESWEPTPENIKRGTASKWHWEVYGLGLRGRREGSIYTRWDITTTWPDRMACQRHGYGLDFGFSVDPTALIECALFQDNLYLREHIYETGLCAVQSKSNPAFRSIEAELVSMMDHDKELREFIRENDADPNDERVLPTDPSQFTNLTRHSKIYADNAQPDSIAELCGVGFNVLACHKGRNSVLAGIDRVRRHQILVHVGSINLQNELENYVWKRDRTSLRFKQEPEDEFNHGLDAVRYWAEEELLPRDTIESREQFKRPRRPQPTYDPYSQLTTGAVI